MPTQAKPGAGGSAAATEPDVRVALIETTVDCLARFGYRGTTVDGVAKQTGCTKGAVYWHFRDKDALVAAALDSVMERWVGGLQDHVEQIDAPLDQLDRVLDNFLRLTLSDRRACDAVQVLALELRSHPFLADRLKRGLEDTANLLYDLLVRGQRDGSIRPDLDARTLAHALAGSFAGILTSCSYGADGIGFGQMVRGLKATYRRALSS
jgi:AcrR family transcriptional regulator